MKKLSRRILWRSNSEQKHSLFCTTILLFPKMAPYKVGQPAFPDWCPVYLPGNAAIWARSKVLHKRVSLLWGSESWMTGLGAVMVAMFLVTRVYNQPTCQIRGLCELVPGLKGKSQFSLLFFWLVNKATLPSGPPFRGFIVGFFCCNVKNNATCCTIFSVKMTDTYSILTWVFFSCEVAYNLLLYAE